MGRGVGGRKPQRCTHPAKLMTRLQPCPRLPERLLWNARLLPDRYAILPLLPKNRTIVEVGVALGAFSSHFLSVCQPKQFIAIDLFNLHEYPSLWGRNTKELFGERRHSEFYRDRFAGAIHQNIVTVLEGDSLAMLATLDDASVDVVYVDADHQYDSVKRELGIIRRKIRDDGFIILNDYIMNEAGFSNAPYGVIQATNEFMISENWEMVYLAFQPYMYCDVVLRKAAAFPAVASPGTNAPLQYDVQFLTRIAELEALQMSLEHALEVMRASTSWRVTAPMRTLVRFLARHQLWPKR